MSCENSSRPLDLAAGLRTRPEDVDALRRARRQPAITLDDYLEFLKTLPEPSPAALRARRGPRGDRPFSL